MASTRNINMPGEYRMQQAALEARRAHVAYEGSTVSEATYFPGDGLLAGRVASAQLAHNGRAPRPAAAPAQVSVHRGPQRRGPPRAARGAPRAEARPDRVGAPRAAVA